VILAFLIVLSAFSLLFLVDLRTVIMINAKSQELNIWLEWAKKKADWYDPMMENSDELNDIDMESLTF
jgi:hypothetical protein